MQGAANAVSMHLPLLQLYMVGICMRNALMAAIYRNCLRLSAEGMASEGTGKIVTLISNGAGASAPWQALLIVAHARRCWHGCTRCYRSLWLLLLWQLPVQDSVVVVVVRVRCCYVCMMTQRLSVVLCCLVHSC
jgi:hypothetical protein